MEKRRLARACEICRVDLYPFRGSSLRLEVASVQRHQHVCIPSIVERPDGTFGAVNSAGGIRSGKKLLGSVYRLQLATELERRGFAIVRADDGWRWSIAGVPDSRQGRKALLRA